MRTQTQSVLINNKTNQIIPTVQNHHQPLHYKYFISQSFDSTSMGKPERKAREKTCSSSSSYLLRCFGISRKIHSHKQMLDDGAGGQEKKKKTRSRWFSRATAFRVKNCEITTTTICETKKHNLTIEDDKQNLFRVIRQVTDPKNITAVGQHETKEVIYSLLSFLFSFPKQNNFFFLLLYS